MPGGEASVCIAVVAEVASLAVLPGPSVGLLSEGRLRKNRQHGWAVTFGFRSGHTAGARRVLRLGALERGAEGASPLRAVANVRSPSARWVGTPASSP